MQDVAEFAGVSVQTVSRVLNERQNVAQSTKERVTEAIQKLNYRRNSAALTLLTQSSRVLGIVDCAVNQNSPYETIRAVERAAHESGYFISLAHANHLGKASVEKVIDSLLEQSVDGIIFIAPHYEALTVIEELETNIPIIVIAAAHDLRYPTLGLDTSLTAKYVMEHLHLLGHERIVHLAGPLDWLDANSLMENWYRAIQSNGLEVLPTYVGDWSAQSGYERGLQIMRESNPTAIFAANDQMALGVMTALQENGLRIPEDVSVIGIGNVKDAAYYFPSLTTVAGKFHEIGTHSIEILIEQIAGKTPESIVFEPELILRRSTGTVNRSLQHSY